MKKKQVIEQPKEFEFTYRYRDNENGRDTTSDDWIKTWKEDNLGHTWGEMSPRQICEGQVKSQLRSIEGILQMPYGDPNWVLKRIGDAFDMLKNWQYLLHCVTLINENAQRSRS